MTTTDTDDFSDPRKYIRIAAALRESIYDGVLKPGDVVHLDGLCKAYECARQTAAKALRLLVDERLLIRWPGLGYHVTSEDA